MKVNPNAPSQTPLTELSLEKTQNKEGVAKPPFNPMAEDTKNSVQISDDARLLKTAKELVGKTADVRSERVEALKAKIREGSYQVDADKVAEKLLEEHLNNDFGKNRL